MLLRLLLGADLLRCELDSELLIDAEFVVTNGIYDGTILVLGGDVDFGGEFPVGFKLLNPLVLTIDGLVGVKFCGM